MPIAAIHRFNTDHDFIEATSKEVMCVIKSTLAHQETCRIGLSGGSTPKGLYKRLSELHIPWDRITLIIIDERFVPVSDPHSNYGMIRDTLLGAIEIPHENVIYFDTSLRRDSAVLAMEQKLLQLKKNGEHGDHCEKTDEPLFNLLILGAGPDGHIAGIFPDTDTDAQKGFLTAKTSTDIFDIHDRLTCTMDALTSCKRALLLLKGHKKDHVLNSLIKGDASTPVGEFVKAVPTGIFAIEMENGIHFT